MPIEVIDLSQEPALVAKRILDAASTVGFFYVQNHGLPLDLVGAVFDHSREFFKLPLDSKKQFANTNGGHGYVASGEERLDVRHPVMEPKEAFNIRNVPRPLPPLFEMHRDSLNSFQSHCHRLCLRLSRLIAVALGLADDTFAGRHDDQQPSATTLRLLHYLPNEAMNDGIRAGCHSDYGTLTLLFQHQIGGLQILLPSSQLDPSPTFVDAPPRDGCIVVNVGDLLQLWTDSACYSAQHRVVAPQGQATERFSIAFFWHPVDEAAIEILPDAVTRCVVKTADAVRQAERERMRFISQGLKSPFTAGEFVRHRLTHTFYSVSNDT